jgi:hypothetical protein
VIYTVALLTVGATATAGLMIECRRAVGWRESVGGATGAIAWIAGEALLLLGICSFTSVGTAHTDGIDIGAVWITPVAVLTAVALLAALQPVRAARRLLQGSGLLVALVSVLTLVTYIADRAEFTRTNFGPLVATTVFVALPALITAALLRLVPGPTAN